MPTLPILTLPRPHPTRRVSVIAVAVLVIAVTGCVLVRGEAVTVEVSSAAGEELRFVPAQVAVSAGAKVALSFANGSAVAHNLVLLLPAERGTRAIVEPGVTDAFEFVAPAAGSYRFVCTIHEGMEGTLEVR